jgi:HSP20 family protein
MPSTRAFDALVESMIHGAHGFPAAATRAFPSMNIWEDAEHFFVEAELPGFSIEDVDISFTNNQLVISGERKATPGSEGEYLRRERGVGKFSRGLRVSSEINAERISASLKNGVLTVTLPKAEAAKPRKITVTSA